MERNALLKEFISWGSAILGFLMVLISALLVYGAERISSGHTVESTILVSTGFILFGLYTAAAQIMLSNDQRIEMRDFEQIKKEIRDCPVVEGLTPEIAFHLTKERERILRILEW